MMDVPDMNAMMAAMQTTAAADAMAFDGVVPELLVILLILKWSSKETLAQYSLGYATGRERKASLRPLTRASNPSPRANP